VDVAIDACRLAGVPLVVAGDGPDREALRARAADADVTFLGRVDDATLAELRAGASIALAPSRSPETFGLAVAEAMAGALPVAASRVGAIPELLEADALVPPGDAEALAAAIARLVGDRAAGRRNLERVRVICAPEVVAEGLRRAYARPASGSRARKLSP
jgi:glycosyltransferase involved in cell wall biosynthesis